MSLLAYLVPQKLDPEPAATQALAYILRSRKLAAEFIRRLGLDFGFEFGHIESERRFEGGQPDLTISDSEGRRRIFIENKFWAGLTDAQPVRYLADLPDDLPSGLVFIVPEQRIPTVWEELKRRSRESYELEDDSPSDTMTRLQMGTRTMCITSWRHVLDLLKQISPDDDVRCDVMQLGGLARFGDSDEFPPLRDDEISDVSIPGRMINYCNLVEPIVEVLEARRVARRGRLQITNDWHDTGRYFKVLDKFDVWLGVAREPWRSTSITPLWLRVTSGECNLGERYHQLDEVFENVQERKNVKYLPIRLRTGVERDEVIRDAVKEVQCIAEKFGKMVAATERSTETV